VFEEDDEASRYRPRRRSAAAPKPRAASSASPGTPKKSRPGGKRRKKRWAAGLLVLVLLAVGFLVRGSISGLFARSGSASSAAAKTAASPTPTIPALAVGDCIDATGTTHVTDTRVDCSDATADYKVLSVVPDVSGDLASDSPKCYSVTGDDTEFETSGADHQPALYCLSSTIDRHSARRAEKGDCIDSSASGDVSYLVGCSDSAANYVVVARVSGTVDTSKCDIYPGATGSLTLAGPPEALLCLKKK
jgi:hypothetical protein